MRARASWTSRSRRPPPAPEGVENQRGGLQPGRPGAAALSKPSAGEPSSRTVGTPPGPAHELVFVGVSQLSGIGGHPGRWLGRACGNCLAPRAPRQPGEPTQARRGSKGARRRCRGWEHLAAGPQSVGGRALEEGPRRPKLQLGARSWFKCWCLSVCLTLTANGVDSARERTEGRNTGGLGRGRIA